MGHFKLNEPYYTVERNLYRATVYKNTLEPALFGYIKVVRTNILDVHVKSIYLLQGYGSDAEDRVKDAAELLFGKLNWKE
jgi:hypothetical protein